jgi:hypothetical protein
VSASAAQGGVGGPRSAGPRSEAVAAALGDSVPATFDRWHEWALRQRDFIVGSEPGITAEVYEMVARKFIVLP